MSEHYRYVIIETYNHSGGSSKHSIRARPLAGQGVPITMRVECSAAMRERHPVGTKLKVQAKIKNTDQAPHLYTSWQWDYQVVSDEDAEAFIRRQDSNVDEP